MSIEKPIYKHREDDSGNLRFSEWRLCLYLERRCGRSGRKGLIGNGFESSFVSSFQLDSGLPLCPEDEKLQMRKWVVKSILESEHSYLNMLDILMQVSILSFVTVQRPF